MGLLVRFLVSLGLFLSFGINAQTFQYKIEGSYSTKFSEVTIESEAAPYQLAPPLGNTIPAATRPSETNPVIINYTIKWNESANTIQGLYQDNYYAQNPSIVTGSVTNLGRTFTTILQNAAGGVKTISIKTSQTGLAEGSIPTNIRTLNSIGSQIDNINTFALMSPIGHTTTPANNSCTIGFGTLTGFCGLYSGSVSEISDFQNRCDLLASGNPRIELGTNTYLTLYLNYINTTRDIPFHALGTFTTSPDGNSISVSRRNCGQLPGTNFPPGNCQILSLNASFFNTAGNITLSGNYTITDETTNESCVYNLFLTREVTY